MKVIETKIPDVLILEPNVFQDDRGYFMESFNAERFQSVTHTAIDFVQDNESKSQKGVLRGLHYQVGEFAQDKLVRVNRGAVQDVVVDLRENSATFGHHVSVVLTEENKRQLLVPAGFAHGFAVLEEGTVFVYKCSKYYHAPSERTLLWNDPKLGIEWMIDSPVLSEKDKLGWTLEETRVKI